MDKLLVVFKREYLERVRSKWFIIATFFGPVFMGLIAVLPAVMASKTRTSTDIANIVVLDATGTDLGERVAQMMKLVAPQSTPPRVERIAADKLPSAEDAATQSVIHHEALGYLVIDSLTEQGKLVRYAGRNASSLVDIGSITGIVRQALLGQRLEKEGIDPSKVQQLTAVHLDSRTEKITDKGREGASGMAGLFFGYGVSLLLYMMIAIYGQQILRSVLEEKTTRVAEVVVSSAPPDTLLAGKVLGGGMVAITQIVAWLSIGYIMYQVRQPILEKFGAGAAANKLVIPAVSPAVFVALILFFILGFIFYASLFAAVGAMVSSQEDAQQAATPVMLLLVSSIIFMQPVLLNPGSTLAKVVSWLPFSAPIMMPLRMSLISISWTEISVVLLGVAIGCVGAIWLAARIYRVGLLMYGKKPSYRELLKWIRYA
ncbi:MAG: hypothetical protein JWO05_1511 [Gemmatimonadetes bacterium]|nr:hypothetical protein [Gemmatimonadota bacterium]